MHSLNVAQDKIMAYIPKEHEKYDVLPMCRRDGRDVFSYPSGIVEELGKKLPDGEHMIPYSYSSMDEMNRKEEWSIVKYIGKTNDNLFGLTHGHKYYWPCSKKNPKYEGVIDDEEFTSYWYKTEPKDWEILLDPTGMAHATIYGGAKF